MLLKIIIIRLELYIRYMYRINKIFLVLVLLFCYCNIVYAANNGNNNSLDAALENHVAIDREIATSSNDYNNGDSSSNDSVKLDININNDNNPYNLKEIAGYKRDENILKEIENDETAKSMFNDLLHELKPYLTGLIDENIPDTYIFSNSDTIEIVVFHPIKFLGALKDYVANSLKEIFAIAEENSEVVTE